jgi:CTP synthase (UTP-ammonia lyase)
MSLFGPEFPVTHRLALIADFDSTFPPHPATERAVRHAAAKLGINVEPVWIGTPELEPHAAACVRGFSGIWIAPGSPYQSLDGVLAAIRFARENEVPLLGTCGGFQHVVIEYARTVLGYADAAHAEYDPYASNLFISRLSCSPFGKVMQVRFVAGSRTAEAYGALAAEEEYYCNFGINPALIGELFGPLPDQSSECGSAGASPSQLRSPSFIASTPAPASDLKSASPRILTISGTDQNGESRVIELPGHSFFVATLYVPQMRSRVSEPHLLVVAWLAAAAGRTDL